MGAVFVMAQGGDGPRRAGAFRSYVAGRAVLSLDGKAMGFLKSASCGEVTADVTRVEASKYGPDAKQIGPARYEPCEFTFGLGVQPELFNWISPARWSARPGRETPWFRAWTSIVRSRAVSSYDRETRAEGMNLSVAP